MGTPAVHLSCACLLVVLLCAGCRADRLYTDAPPPTWTEASTGMVFVRIDPGAFTMGSPSGEVGREAQETQHSVRLSRTFWMGRTEVTQAEWTAVMGSNPSHFADRGGAHPVEQVNWHDVHAFLRRLAARAPGNRFRLPTEAEWEYTCRAGTATPYMTGGTLGPADANVTVVDRSGGGASVVVRRGTVAVASFAPNGWGLFDMHGNVWEWTADAHCPYPAGAATDPSPTCDSPPKVIRGGSWYFEADSARCALRYTHHPQDLGFSLGFRVVREG
jgi:formylglycine-generating enzyme required for sulfatase activity